MTRQEAAVKVGKAFQSVKAVYPKPDPKKKESLPEGHDEAKPVSEVVKDAKATGFFLEMDGHIAEYDFKYGAHAHEQRKDEVARFKLALVDEIVKREDKPLFRKVEEKPKE